MPTYTFQCRECGLIFDRRFHFHEKVEGVTCPRGHTEVVRIFRPPAVVFKGSGFYITDSRKAHNAAGGNNGKGETASKAAASAATASAGGA